VGQIEEWEKCPAAFLGIESHPTIPQSLSDLYVYAAAVQNLITTKTTDLESYTRHMFKQPGAVEEVAILKASLATNIILWRFLTVTFYRAMLAGSTRNESERYAFHLPVVKLMVKDICEHDSHDPAVKANVSAWIKEGKKHYLLAKALGGPEFHFYYPVKLNDWM
jgi:hypothetical protein